MSQRKESSKPNGHAGANGRVNGHGSASAEQGGVLARGDRAASDDARGKLSATALAPAAVAGTDREACAAAATPPPNGAAANESSKEHPKSKKDKEPKGIPPGEHPLPDDPAEFVQEIHRKIDLTKVWHSLLRSKDPKIKQRAAERLTDLLYKLGAESADEAQQIIFDMPRPQRD